MAKRPKQPPQADQTNPPVETSKEAAPVVASPASTEDQPKPKKTEYIYGLKVESY